MKRRTGTIYFLQAHNQVKIGYTRDLKSRLKDLQTSCPTKLSCLFVFPGTRQDEKNIHHRLAQHRSHGEWFFYSNAVQSFINWLAVSEKLPNELMQPELPFEEPSTDVAA